MERREYTIQDAVGLHARPVSLIARIAMPYKNSKITLSCGEKSADAIHMLAVMDMQVKQGDTIVVTVEGGQEILIADTILNVFIYQNL
ncbi:MAG: HPr family phosphocarrier protein [Anaerolineaceae bacterium]|nr:HPr family phosphocarrier protein [Anaerolineaceae bacterium]